MPEEWQYNVKVLSQAKGQTLARWSGAYQGKVESLPAAVERVSVVVGNVHAAAYPNTIKHVSVSFERLT